MNNSLKIRRAKKAGSWYEGKADILEKQLNQWLSTASKKLRTDVSVKAIISPKIIICERFRHAGYSYSGPTAAYAFQHILPSSVSRVFLLGPSHHTYIDGCSLSQFHHYSTPFGNLDLDLEKIEELHKTGKFGKLDKNADEQEHSLELMLPYLYHRAHLSHSSIKIIPILVGSISSEKSDTYAKILSQELQSQNTFFIISSDFCHWGKRFDYTFYDSDHGPIWKSIEALDQLGMKTISTKSSKNFQEYLEKYQNTICGRNPITLFLRTLELSGTSERMEIDWVEYAQSNHCQHMNDSSVSYASAIIYSVDEKK